MKLSVLRGGKVRLTLPRGVRRADAVAFIQEQAEWLVRTINQTAPTQTVSSHLERFPWVSVAGKLCSLECAETMVRPFLVFREGEELVIFRYRGGEHHERDLLYLLRKLAVETLPGRVQFLADRIAIPFGRVSVRDQQGRWGSCSTQGTVSLNWRLVLLPPVLQDYVILHELAHRRHMDHSERFWAQVAAWDPDWKKDDRTLTKQWGGLMDLGRE
jgi:predicted metal-dependent hydrolase